MAVTKNVENVDDRLAGVVLAVAARPDNPQQVVECGFVVGPARQSQGELDTDSIVVFPALSATSLGILEQSGCVE